MPTTNPYSSFSRPSKEKGRNGKLAQKAKSFHGKAPAVAAPLESIPRPRTLPELLSRRGLQTAGDWAGPPRLTKLLLNVTVQRSLGPVQVVMSPEETVGGLVREAVRVYGKEGRRPLLPSTDPACFGLHYSQFSLESLDSKEKLINLGSRNFFLCPRQVPGASSCSNQAEKASKNGFPWLRFMGFSP